MDFPQGWWFQFWLTRGLESTAKVLQDQAYKQGLGRHSREEVGKWGMEGMQALSDYLGDKPYLMGDKPSQVDCILFGCLAILVHAPFGEETEDFITKNFPNMQAYLERLKANYYPDWNQLLTNDQTRI